MGLRTWESLPKRPLPGRTNVVLSDAGTNTAEECVIATDLSSALQLATAAPGGETIWVIGGESVYRQTIEFADRVEITEVDLSVNGDTFAPGISATDWNCTIGEWQKSQNGLKYRFLSFIR